LIIENGQWTMDACRRVDKSINRAILRQAPLRQAQGPTTNNKLCTLNEFTIFELLQ